MRWDLRSWNGCAVVAMVVLAACTPEKTPPGEPRTTAKTEGQGGPSYAMADFSTVRKFDAHVHANDRGTALLEQARADNFGLLSINVDYPDFPSLLEQHAIAVAQAQPDRSWGRRVDPA